MEFREYYISNKEGKSNCVIRTFCKLFNKSYDDVFNELSNLARALNSDSFNDVLVFETYLKDNGFVSLDCNEFNKVFDLKLNNGRYVIFCYDKKEYYHMCPIIDNVIYDKNDECLNLYILKVYKEQ